MAKPVKFTMKELMEQARFHVSDSLYLKHNKAGAIERVQPLYEASTTHVSNNKFKLFLDNGQIFEFTITDITGA